MSDESTKMAPPALVAAMAWLVPGSGYWLIGQRARALTVGLGVLGMFALGLLIGGVRVVELPYYKEDNQRRHVYYDPKASLVPEIKEKPWFIPQILTGPVTILTGKLSVHAANSGVFRSHARLNDIGTLYTAVAGMLNLMAIMDSAYRAGHNGARS